MLNALLMWVELCFQSSSVSFFLLVKPVGQKRCDGLAKCKAPSWILPSDRRHYMIYLRPSGSVSCEKCCSHRPMTANWSFFLFPGLLPIAIALFLHLTLVFHVQGHVSREGSTLVWVLWSNRLCCEIKPPCAENSGAKGNHGLWPMLW